MITRTFRVQFLFIISLNIFCCYSSKTQNRQYQSSSVKKPKYWTEEQKCYSTNSATCEENLTESVFCFGAKISYPFASLSNMVTGQSSYNALFGDYDGLPECWSLFRELICSVQYANCSKSKVKLVSKNLCTKTLTSCKFLLDANLWPVDIGDCTDSTMFAESCSVVDVEAKFNWNHSVIKTCVHPLVHSKFQPGWYLRHCAFNCTSHWLTQSEHEHMNQVVSIGSISAFVFTLVTYLTLVLANSKKLSIEPPKNPITNLASKPLKWYLLFNSIAIGLWIIQYIPGARNSLICRDDGSLRRSEIAQEGQGNFWCGLQFGLFYFCITLSPYWLCIFSYSMLVLREKEKRETRSFFWRSLFHFAYAVPFVASVVYLFILFKVEGDGISGICFIGYSDPLMLFIFVYTPLGVMLMISLAFFFYGIFKRSLLKLPTGANVDDSFLKYKQPDYPVFQLGLFWLIQSLSFVVSLTLQIKQTLLKDIMDKSFFNFLECQIRNQADQECKLENRPDVRLIEMHLLIYFICAISTDILLLVGGNIFSVWKEVAKRILRYRSYFTKSPPPLANDKPMTMDLLSTCETKSTQSNSSVSDFVDISSKCDDTHKSKKNFIDKMNSRSRLSSHRKSASFSRTPSSLKSGSLPTGMNCSMAELPFDDINKGQKMPPYYFQPYPHHPYGQSHPFAQWYTPPWPVFYPQFSPVMPSADAGFFDQSGKISVRQSPETRSKEAISDKNDKSTSSPNSAAVVNPATGYPMNCYYPPPAPNPWYPMYHHPAQWMHPYYQQCPTAVASPKVVPSATVEEHKTPDEPSQITRTADGDPQTSKNADIESLQTTENADTEPKAEEKSPQIAAKVIENESDFSGDDDDDESFTSSNFDEEEEEFVRKKLAQLSREQLPNS